MGCCGDNKIEVVKNIAVGVTRLATDKIGLTQTKSFVALRIEVCSHCDKSTRLTWTEHLWWAAKNAKEIIKKLDHLETLPELPKYELDAERRILYCMICKCCVYAKARVKASICIHPKGNKWDLNN